MKIIPSPLAGLTILVVDDEVDLREAIAYEFVRRGGKILEAGTGKEAFAIFESRPVDIVVTDVRMPNGTGIELLSDIRKLNPSVPLVFLVTGFADITEEEAKEKGANGMVHKPFDRKKLLELIEGFAQSLPGK